MNNDSERVGKEVVAALFKALSQHLSGGNEKTTKPSVRIADLLVEI
jgi:hypothetical protein